MVVMGICLILLLALYISIIKATNIGGPPPTGCA